MPRMDFIYDTGNGNDYGADGLRSADHDHFTPGWGRTVAHDMLDHFPVNVDRSLAHDELLALGASLRVRGESWWARQDYRWSSPRHVSLKYDVDTTLEETLWQGQWDLPAPPDRVHRLRDDYAEDCIQHVERRLRDEGAPALQEYLADGGDPDFPADYPARVAAALREGYRAACRRYNGVPQWRLAEAYDNVAREVDRLGTASAAERIETRRGRFIGALPERGRVRVAVSLRTERVAVSLRIGSTWHRLWT